MKTGLIVVDNSWDAAVTRKPSEAMVTTAKQIKLWWRTEPVVIKNWEDHNEEDEPVALFFETVSTDTVIQLHRRAELAVQRGDWECCSNDVAVFVWNQTTSDWASLGWVDKGIFKL